MANDIPSPRETSVERFREAVRIHNCEISGCPYCLIRDWVNEKEEKLKKASVAQLDRASDF